MGRVQVRRRGWAVLAVVTLTVGMFAFSAPPSGANILPTTTTVKTNSNPALSTGSTVTYTATVSILGISLGSITPTGTVTFRIGSEVLGSAPITGCVILAPCTASWTGTVTPPEGYDDYWNPAIVTARYNGDSLAAASQGTVGQFFLQPKQCDDTGVNEQHFGYCRHDGTATNGSSALLVEVPTPEEGTEQYQIEIHFTQVALSCSNPAKGDTAIFDVSIVREKTVFYTINGNAATTANNTDPDAICWSSDLPFTTDENVPAVLKPNGMYEGGLPVCPSPSFSFAPCVVGSVYDPPFQDCPTCPVVTPARLTTEILAPPGDPGMGRK